MKTETPLNDNLSHSLKNTTATASTALINGSTCDSVSTTTTYYHWLPLYQACPVCGSMDTEYKASLNAISSHYHCRCKKCEYQWITSDAAINFTQPQTFNERRGWICPNCGSSINPDVHLCPRCSGGYSTTITYGTSSNPYNFDTSSCCNSETNSQASNLNGGKVSSDSRV